MPSSDRKAHLIGRGEMTGPVSGQYHSFTFQLDNVAASTTNRHAWFQRLPWDFRPLNVYTRTASEDVTSATLDVRYDVSNTVGATSILTAELDATQNLGVAAGYNSGDDTTITAGVIVPKDYILMVRLNTVGGTTGLTDVTVVISGFILGHINDSEADDTGELVT